jgi:hypothetical protein
MKHLSLAISLVLISSLVYAQSKYGLNTSSSLSWMAAINGEKHDDAYDIIECADGRVLIVGETWSNSTFPELKGRGDALLIMMERTGKIVWQKTFGTKDIDVARTVCQLPNGNFVIGGSSQGSMINDEAGHSHYPSLWTFTIDAQGNQLSATISETFGEISQIVSHSDLSYSCAASSDSSLLITHVNKNGENVWTHKIESEYYVRAHSMVVDGEDNIYVYGSTYEWKKSDPDKAINQVWIKKLNNNGKEIWTVDAGNSGYNLCGDLKISPDGTIMFTTTLGDNGHFGCGNQFDYALIRFDKDGKHLKGDQCYGDAGIEQPTSISIASDGSIWMLSDNLTMKSSEFGQEMQRSMVLQQVNQQGDILNMKYHDLESIELTSSVLALSGQVIVVSNEQIKNENGYQDDIRITSYFLESHSIPPVSDVLELPSTLPPSDLSEQQMTLGAPEEISPSKEELNVNLYPNPGNDEIRLVSDQDIKRVRILDSSGQIVYDQRRIEQQTHLIDISQLSAGVYYAEVKSGNETVLKRFIKE